jgi:hypothetical protein
MFIYAKVSHSKFVEMQGDASDFIDPHCYFILDTGLILQSIELFIYIQTCVNVKVMHYMQIRNKL